MNSLALLKSWKTTITGVTLPIVAYLQVKGVIDAETASMILAVLTGLGLVSAKDGNKSSEDVGVSNTHTAGDKA